MFARVYVSRESLDSSETVAITAGRYTSFRQSNGKKVSNASSAVGDADESRTSAVLEICVYYRDNRRVCRDCAITIVRHRLCLTEIAASASVCTARCLNIRGTRSEINETREGSSKWNGVYVGTDAPYRIHRDCDIIAREICNWHYTIPTR